MPRVYVHRFDHDEARRRYEAGETCSMLAATYGVSYSAIYFVVNAEAQEKMRARSAAWQRSGTCPDCGGPSSRTTGRSRRCIPCLAKAQAITARDGELECQNCREWKPDAAFPHDRSNKIGRRGRNSVCRPCQTVLRRARRAANPEASRAYEREYKRRTRASATGDGAAVAPKKDPSC